MIHQAKNLSFFSELRHGFTDRQLGTGYLEVAHELQVSPHSLLSLKQIHSNQAHLIQKPLTETLEGDALVTHTSGMILSIRTADCVPLLLYDPQNKAAAAIHAGWRGLISGIIENTFEILKTHFSSTPSSLLVAIGPALCLNCFEIGPEVKEKFEKKFNRRLAIRKGEGDRSFIDLREGCRVILEELGVLWQNIETLPFCTSCNHELFYSYRRGDKEGRMIGFIGIL